MKKPTWYEILCEQLKRAEMPHIENHSKNYSKLSLMAFPDPSGSVSNELIEEAIDMLWSPHDGSTEQIILFDEVTAASPAIQEAMFKVFEGRRAMTGTELHAVAEKLEEPDLTGYTASFIAQTENIFRKDLDTVYAQPSEKALRRLWNAAADLAVNETMQEIMSTPHEPCSKCGDTGELDFGFYKRPCECTLKGG